MSISMRDVDPAFSGAGQKAGLEIWRIENFRPVSVPTSSYGKFFTGDSYVILKTTTSKSGALRYDIHYWLGKDSSQDEAGTAAIKTIELDAALGGRAVQYREQQGQETEKFLSYFKPCIIPQEGGTASGFKHHEADEYVTRLYICRGRHVVRVNEVAFARTSLNHDDVFILDTKSKIFQFNGAKSCIPERAKALEVVQFIKDSHHDGQCDVAGVEDGRLMADADAGEFWALFGGFAPLQRKVAVDQDIQTEETPPKLLCIEKGQAVTLEADSLTRGLLDSNKCYLLDFGLEVFIWAGRNTPLDERKSANVVAEEYICNADRPQAQLTRVTEGFETVMFRSKFDSWPRTSDATATEDGRGKVAALLKRQGLDVKGLVKAAPTNDELEPHIDCTGDLQVWRVNGLEKSLLEPSEQSKLYTGDCYIFHYSYPGDNNGEYLIGSWFGRQSVEEEKAAAVSLASKMVESLKLQAVQARIFEGKEPIQFFAIFQSCIIFKGGISSGYKNYLSENQIADETYTEDGIALFRVQGSGPENMQAIQVEPVASSLNSCYCYVLQNDSAVFTWSGSMTTADDQDLVERQLDVIKPDVQSKPLKEGTETEQFWDLLGGKREFPSQKIAMEPESDPHLFLCIFLKGNLKVIEIFNFTQDDLMTEDIYILDCHSEIFVWIGKQVESSLRMQALTIGEKFLEHDFLLESSSRETPIFIVKEGGEPSFFMRFFNWDPAKSSLDGNSFQRKLAMLKKGFTAASAKPKRRTQASFGGRSGGTDKPAQRSRSMSLTPDRARVRGRSPAFKALAANFENQNARNLSTPPPRVSRLYPRSSTADSSVTAPRSAAIAALTANFELSREQKVPRFDRVSRMSSESTRESESWRNNSVTRGIQSLTLQNDSKDNDAEGKGLPSFPYERLKVSCSDPITGIDVTKREAYLSSEEFEEKFGMKKVAFYNLPRWKQQKLKMTLELF